MAEAKGKLRNKPGITSLDEMRLVADLRIMHAKVEELYQICQSIRKRHHEGSVTEYADAPLLAEDIRKVDELYLWFIRLKEEPRKRKVVNGE